jgi:hypothetical protein
MPDVRQRVVLRDEGDGRTRAAELRNKRGFDAVGTNLDIEAGARRSISEPSAGLMLLESELGGVMNAMAQVNQERGEGTSTVAIASAFTPAASSTSTARAMLMVTPPRGIP